MQRTGAVGSSQEVEQTVSLYWMFDFLGMNMVVSETE